MEGGTGVNIVSRGLDLRSPNRVIQKMPVSNAYLVIKHGQHTWMLPAATKHRFQQPEDSVILFSVEIHLYSCHIVLFSLFLPRVTIRNDHMNTFSSSSLKATIKDIFFYYSNLGLDSC